MFYTRLILSLLSDLPPQHNPDLVGTWVLVAMGLLGGGLGIAVLIKNLISKPDGAAHITKAEYDITSKKIDEFQIKILEYVTRRDLESVISTIEQHRTNLEQHRVNLVERINDLRIAMEEMHRHINKEVQDLVIILADRLERHQKALVTTLLGKPSKSKQLDDDV